MIAPPGQRAGRAAEAEALFAAAPGRYGFTYGGPFSSSAFSPDGRHLAVFLNITNPQDSAQSGSYVVNTLTLAARPFSFSGSPGHLGDRPACPVTQPDRARRAGYGTIRWWR